MITCYDIHGLRQLLNLRQLQLCSTIPSNSYDGKLRKLQDSIIVIAAEQHDAMPQLNDELNSLHQLKYVSIYNNSPYLTEYQYVYHFNSLAMTRTLIVLYVLIIPHLNTLHIRGR